MPQIVRFRLDPRAAKYHRNNAPPKLTKVSGPPPRFHFHRLPAPPSQFRTNSCRASGDGARTQAEQSAWAAVDHALATAKDEVAAGANDAKKVFNELRGVDEAISAACSSVIACLLQVWATFLHLFLAPGSRASCISLMLPLPRRAEVSVFSGRSRCPCRLSLANEVILAAGDPAVIFAILYAPR